VPIIPEKSGDERDCFDPMTRRHVGRKAGKRKKIKRGYNKRVRREDRAKLKKRVSHAKMGERSENAKRNDEQGPTDEVQAGHR